MDNSLIEISPAESQSLPQTLSPFYHDEYGSPSLSSSQDFSPEYSPSVPPPLAPLSLSPLTRALQDFSVDDKSPYSINQPLSATSEEFLSAWQHESSFGSEFSKETNVGGLLLGSDLDAYPASPLSGFHHHTFDENFQLGSQFDGQFISVDDDQLATDDHIDYRYTTNVVILSPTPRHPSTDSLSPHQDRPMCNRRHSHSHGTESTLDSINQLRHIHSATDISADPVLHPNTVFDDHDVPPHPWSEPPPPHLSLDPSPTSDTPQRAIIASDAVLRAAAARRRKKAAFGCHICGNFLTSKDNLNSE